MANVTTDCLLLDNRLPSGGSFGPFRVSFEPGRVTFDCSVTLPTWAAGNMGGLGCKDYVFAVDGRMLVRSWGERIALLATGGAEIDNPDGSKTKQFSIVADWAYFGWSPGRHYLTFGLIQGDYDRVICNSTFAFDIPSTVAMDAVAPSPALVSGKILRNYFFLSPLRNSMAEPGMTARDLRDAGINCLTVGGFYWPQSSTFVQWRDSWDSFVFPEVDWCVANDFYCIVNMDGLYRSTVERQWWDTCPWRDDALRHVRDQLASRRPTVAAISGLDEVLWGPGQSPVDTRALHALWQGHPAAPPWAWPAYAPDAYETTDQADYSIRYIANVTADTTMLLSESGRGWSLPQRARLYEIMRGRVAHLPPGWPLGCLLGGCLTYQKMVDGAYCCPYPSPADKDILLNEGVLPEHAMANVWLPLVLVRPIPTLLLTYFYDWLGAKQERAAAIKQPAGMLQQGVVFGSPPWRAMGRAFKSVEARESLLTSRTPLPSGYVDNWATGGVEGLEIAINCAPFARRWRGVIVPAGGVWFSDGEVL